MKHGTRYAYERAGCRCPDCRRTQTQRRKAQRERQNERGAPINHGKVSAYVARKCRCALCRRAWADYFAPYRRAADARSRLPRPPFGSPAWRAEQERLQREFLSAAVAADSELAALVEEQERDASRFMEGRPWQASLDAAFKRSRDDDVGCFLDLVTDADDEDEGLGRVYQKRGRYEAPRDATFVAPLLAVLDRRREIDSWAVAA